MSRSEPAVFTNMCMISDGNGNILVQDRRNPDWPGITFPGGHVEPGEAFTASVIREVLEETGLTRDGYLANLRYDSGTVTEISGAEIPLVLADGTASLNTAALEAACGETLYTVRLMAAGPNGTVYSTEGQAGETLTMGNLPENLTFTAEAWLANRDVLVKFGVPEVIGVEVYVDRQQTVSLEGALIPDASGAEGIAGVFYWEPLWLPGDGICWASPRQDRNRGPCG